MGRKCLYCGLSMDHYTPCTCASDYASVSSFDRKPTSLNDPNPVMGSGSEKDTGIPAQKHESVQMTEYVGKKLSDTKPDTKR